MSRLTRGSHKGMILNKNFESHFRLNLRCQHIVEMEANLRKNVGVRSGLEMYLLAGFLEEKRIIDHDY